MTAPRILYTSVIYGQAITKKNSNRVITGRNGRPFVIPSAQYEAYEAEALPQLKKIPEPISEPCNVEVVYYVKDLVKRDLLNLLAATCDILVDAGVLKDDNWKIAYSHDGSHVVLDRKNPRAVITITSREDVFKYWEPTAALARTGTTSDAPPLPLAQNIM